jgi:chemotaxis receptor (MCP) glutamine deamidase CheD
MKKHVIYAIIERVFPSECAEIRKRHEAQRLQKRTAMQQMIDADLALRANGCETNRINAKLRTAVQMYDNGRYSSVGANVPMV